MRVHLMPGVSIVVLSSLSKAWSRWMLGCLLMAVQQEHLSSDMCWCPQGRQPCPWILGCSGAASLHPNSCSDWRTSVCRRWCRWKQNMETKARRHRPLWRNGCWLVWFQDSKEILLSAPCPWELSVISMVFMCWCHQARRRERADLIKRQLIS